MDALTPPGGNSARPTRVAADDKATPTPIDFLKKFFLHTAGPIYTCSFPNDRHDEKQVAERHVISRTPADITSFISKWDKPKRGLFFCVATLKPGTQKRNKENVAQTVALHIDMDFKNIDFLGGDPFDESMKHLARLKYLPSITVKSGGGVHAYWFLTEPLDAQANMERIEAVLRQLADVLAGDLAVCEVSRVMRMPGSHNTKEGNWHEVEITSFDPDRRYEFDDIEEWLSEQSPLLLRKVREHGQTVVQTDLDFFARYGREHGIKPPIDVEQRLGNMVYMGGGDCGIHQTQIQCSAALLSRGTPIDDVVAIILAATRVAAGGYGKRWNWRIEERNIRSDCEGWIKKHPPQEKRPKPAKPTLVKSDTREAEAEQQPQPTVAGNVVQMPVITPCVPKKTDKLHIVLGKAVIAHVRDVGEELISTEDGFWHYANGVWELRIGYKWLNSRIDKVATGFGYASDTNLVNETRNWIERNPGIWRDVKLPWDQHGKIPTRSGLVDPVTGELESARPDHFCTWRVEVEYDKIAACPWWETMIADMFGDRPDAERDALVGVVQELMGAALIDKKPRALSKACVFWGNENRAKSGVLDVVSGLFGGDPIVAPLSAIEGPHGLMPFKDRKPWVLHEAFGGQWHFSSIVKSIITQEPAMINIKNGPMLSRVIRSPVFWATNHAPQFKEATRAIVSRMMVIEVTRQFEEDKPIGAAAEAIRRGFSKPGEFIVATELPGVLNWAIAGLTRALDRGSIASTDSIAATAKAIHQDSNLVAGFLEECVEFDPMARLRVSDFCLAHSVWFLQMKGEGRSIPSNDSIGKAMKAIGDPRIGMHPKEMRDNTSRFYCGIALNKSGLDYHKTGFDSRLFDGKVAMVTTFDQEVNSLIPPSWDARESVVAMRKAHQS